MAKAEPAPASPSSSLIGRALARFQSSKTETKAEVAPAAVEGVGARAALSDGRGRQVDLVVAVPAVEEVEPPLGRAAAVQGRLIGEQGHLAQLRAQQR